MKPMTALLDRLFLWWYLLDPMQVAALCASAWMFAPVTAAILTWAML